MKNKLSIILLIITVFSLTISLYGCGDTTNSSSSKSSLEISASYWQSESMSHTSTEQSNDSTASTQSSLSDESSYTSSQSSSMSSSSSKVLPKPACIHEHLRVFVPVAPTCTSAGSKGYVECPDCGFTNKSKSLEIPMLSHDYDVNGICKHCDMEEVCVTTEDDFITFGRFPQTKVDNQAIITKLNQSYEMLPNADNDNGWVKYNNYTNGNMWCLDTCVMIDGKYEDFRAVYFNQYRFENENSYYSNSSYQQNNGYNKDVVYWFKFEPIKWRIAKTEGNNCVLIAESILDAQAFKSGYSDLVLYLNSNFAKVAFNSLERNIITTPNANEPIYILNQQLALNNELGFSANTNTKYNRLKSSTDYAKCEGIECDATNGNAKWWLSSCSGPYANYNDYVTDGGGVVANNTTYYNSRNNLGVVPAVTINFSLLEGVNAHNCNEHLTDSIAVSPTCTENGLSSAKSCDECGRVVVKANVIPATGHTYTSSYECDVCHKELIKRNAGIIEFGSYPSAMVSDDSTIHSLNEVLVSLNPVNDLNGWTSYDSSHSYSNAWYSDVSLNGEKYRAIYFSAYRVSNLNSQSIPVTPYQSANGYYVGNLYWFKYEPIKWRIITEQNNKFTLWCESVIDANYFSSDNSVYDKSFIRKFLNNEFYNMAFVSSDRKFILSTLVDNSQAQSYNFYSGGQNTNDFVYLPSYSQATTMIDNSKLATDYAKALGCRMYNNYGYNGAYACWLRSTYSLAVRISTINYQNSLTSSMYTYYTYGGVAPMITIELPELNN